MNPASSRDRLSAALAAARKSQALSEIFLPGERSNYCRLHARYGAHGTPKQTVAILRAVQRVTEAKKARSSQDIRANSPCGQSGSGSSIAHGRKQAERTAHRMAETPEPVRYAPL